MVARFTEDATFLRGRGEVIVQPGDSGGVVAAGRS